MARPAKERSHGLTSRYRVRVLDRAVQVLEELAKAGLELGPSEIAARLSLHKSTIHRLLAVLEEHRLVTRNPEHGKYTLGTKLFELGNRSVAYIELRSHAMPFLQRLVDETHETAHVGALDGTEMLSLANVEGPWTLRLRSVVGSRSPVHCTGIGKSVLAFLPARELVDILERQTLVRFTRRTIVTRTALKQELQRIRARGFAVDDEEREQGLRCVSAPIRDHTGRVAAALSIAGPVFRVTRERLPALARSVLAAARDLSAAIGYAEPRSATLASGDARSRTS